MEEWSEELEVRKAQEVGSRAYDFVKNLALPVRYAVTEDSFSALPIQTQGDCRRMLRELTELRSAEVSTLCAFALWAMWFSAAKSVFYFSAANDSDQASTRDDFLSSPENYLKFNGKATTLFEQLMPDDEPKGRKTIRLELGLQHRPLVDWVLKALSLYLFSELSRNTLTLSVQDAIVFSNEASKASALADQYTNFVVSMSRQRSPEVDEQIARRELARTGASARAEKNDAAKIWVVEKWKKLSDARAEQSLAPLSKSWFAKNYALTVRAEFPSSIATERTIRSWI